MRDLLATFAALATLSGHLSALVVIASARVIDSSSDAAGSGMAAMPIDTTVIDKTNRKRAAPELQTVS
jgi:hypothetical protein